MTEVVLSAVYHAVLGVLLAVAVWGVGLGWLLLRSRRAAAIDAYAVGLLVVTAAAFLALLSSWLVPFSLALVLVPLVALRHAREAAALAWRPLAWALPGALGLGVALGLLQHGPTEEADSSAYGDMLFYVNKLVSATQTVVPFHDLLAEGQRIIYTEGAPSFLGGALAWLPGLDPVLYHAAALPAFLGASVAIGLGLSRAARTAPAWTAAAAALVAIVLVPYPTWITESPPIALAIPLAFSIARLTEERLPARTVAALAGLVAVDLFLTKVVGLVVLAVVAAFVLFRRLDRRAIPYAAAGLCAAAALAIAALFLTAGWYADLLKAKFLPLDAWRGVREQLDHRDTQAAAPAFAIVGEALLGLALVRLRLWPYAAALGAAVLGSWFAGGYGFDVAVGLAVLLAALAFWRDPSLLVRARVLMPAAGVALALSAWFRDVSAARAGFVLVVLLAVALFGAFATSAGAPWRASAYGLAAGAVAIAIGLTGRSVVGLVVLGMLALVPLVARRPAVVGATLAIAALLSAGLAARAATRDDLTLSHQAVTLTRDDYRMWRRVHELVPRDGLVFTSLTGEVVDARHGWNNYPSIAGRQLYVAGWYDGRLVARPDERRRRLALNADVLAARVPPGSVPTARRFGSFYAVLWRAETPPPSFRPLYANGLLALYRIP